MANLNKQGFIDIDPNTLTEQELFLLYQTMKGYEWRYGSDPEYSEEYKKLRNKEWTENYKHHTTKDEK